MRRVCILGSTGSIGQATLDVIAQHTQHFCVYALVADRNVEQMLADCLRFQPCYVALTNTQAAARLREQLQQHQSHCVLDGEHAACELAALEELDTVMAAIVGSAGLPSTWAAVCAGKRVLLANKESLVMAGAFLLQAARTHQASIIPVDSEHNAIFQCLSLEQQQCLGHLDLNAAGVEKIYLTGSGGALRDVPLTQLHAVTPKQALQHPTWSMGPKITIDSATMINKGLEYIEARWLFNASAAQIEVVLHPQSVIHSMLQYQDGAIVAQMGPSCMQMPIAHALHYPKRLCMPALKTADITQLSQLTFTPVDWMRYPCLQLAIEVAFERSAPLILNAANEVAVGAFLQERIGFGDIYALIQAALSEFSSAVAQCVQECLQLDQQVRVWAEQRLCHLVRV